MDPITIVSLAAIIASAIFAGTGPIIGKLWRAIKGFYGRVCSSRRMIRSFLPSQICRKFGQLLTPALASSTYRLPRRLKSTEINERSPVDIEPRFGTTTCVSAVLYSGRGERRRKTRAKWSEWSERFLAIESRDRCLVGWQGGRGHSVSISKKKRKKVACTR